jgi:outer membrane protein assembly factor BamB
VDGSIYQVLGDTLYAIEPRPAGTWLTAYPLTDGPVRWSVPVDLPVTPATTAVRLHAMGDVLALSSVDAGPDGDRTWVVDRRTGAIRWHDSRFALVQDQVRGRVLLTEAPSARVLELAPASEIVSVQVDDARPVWRYHREDGCRASVLPVVTDPDTGLAVLCPDGSLRVVDLASGRIRAAVPIPAAAFGVRSAGFGGTTGVQALADRVVISYPQLGRSVLAAFESDHLSPLWTIRLDLGSYRIFECTRRLCLFNSAAVLALDPATGAVIWRTDTARGMTPIGDRYLLGESRNGDQLTLIDPGSGAAVLDFGSWSVEPFGVTEVLLLRRERLANRLWLARLSSNPIGIQVLGFLTGVVPDSCWFTGDHLLCRTVEGVRRVWRMNPPG